MELHLQPNTPPAGASNISVNKSRSMPSPSDRVDLGDSQNLDRILAATAETRPEAVNRARALIADVQYPPKAVIQSIANLLGMNLGSEEP